MLKVDLLAKSKSQEIHMKNSRFNETQIISNLKEAGQGCWSRKFARNAYCLNHYFFFTSIN